jgi:hypothetical protein
MDRGREVGYLTLANYETGTYYIWVWEAVEYYALDD